MKRQHKFHIHNSTVLLLAVAVVALINFVTHRHYKKWDLSQAKQFSLSDQTKTLLSKLDKKIQLIGFFDKTTEATFDDLVDKYTYESKYIEKRLADLDVDIGLAEQHDIRQKNVIVVVGPQKTVKITDFTEEDLTNALTKVTQAQQKKLYFVSGHFEKSLKDDQREGLSQLKQELENTGYTIEELSLIQKSLVPVDCSVLVIAGAQKDFFPKEKELIEAYVNKGGHLFYLLDPKAPLALKKLLDDWKVKVHDNLIVDPTSQLFLPDPRIVVALNYSEHEIVKKLSEKKVYTLFPWTRSFESLGDSSSQVSFQHLTQTTDQAWGETSYNDKKFKFDAGKDLKGPLTVAAALTKKILKSNDAKESTPSHSELKDEESITKIVLFGSSGIVSNDALYAQGNRDLVLNTISWLAGDIEQVSIRPNKAGLYTLQMSKNQAATVGLLLVVLMPLGILVFGILFWIIRRKK
ncbi:MAG: GldG family protein [Deltaproteobacteria bacterium]|nr:GldG family protein [Deltaproteobacteria bacterium]